MKIKPVYWVVLALALAFGVAVCDGLRLRDKYSIVVGNMQTEKITQEKLVATKDALISATQADNKKLIGKNLDLVNKMGQTTSAIGQARVSEAAAKAESDKFKTEVQPVIDANPKLKEFVGGLEARLVQKDGIITQQDALILTLGVPKLEGFVNGIPIFSYPEKSVTGNLDKMRLGEIGIGESWKAKFEGENRLRTLAEKGWKASERKLKWTRVLSNIKTGLILAAVAAVGYEELKGK